MELHFHKYQGAGNDFIIVRDSEQIARLTPEQIATLCHRHFGVGADGFIRIGEHSTVSFEMYYHNADGRPGSMCGNGARCAFDFAAHLGLVDTSGTFMAVDGLHAGRRLQNGWVGISMQDVGHIDQRADCLVIDTGSPHYVRFVEQLSTMDVVAEGRKIRYSDEFTEHGINVNLVQSGLESLQMSTYERGVEDQTLACGTGATAVALAYAVIHNLTHGPVRIQADGGSLAVNFRRLGDTFSEIELQGPVHSVFTGVLTV